MNGKKDASEIPAWVFWAISLGVTLLIAAGVHGGERIYTVARDWQTLATGVLAIVAARWTILEMRAAYHQQEDRFAYEQRKSAAIEQRKELPLWKDHRDKLESAALQIQEAIDTGVDDFWLNLRTICTFLEYAHRDLFALVDQPEWQHRLAVLNIDDMPIIAACYAFDNHEETATNLKEIGQDEYERRAALGELEPIAALIQEIKDDCDGLLSFLDEYHPDYIEIDEPALR